MSEKCFCHITDRDGNVLMVKDKEARASIKALDSTVSAQNIKIVALEKASLRYATSQLNQTLLMSTPSPMPYFINMHKGSISIPSTVTPKLIILTISTTHFDAHSDLVVVVPIKEGETIQSMHTISPSNDLECVETLYQNHTLYITVHCSGNSTNSGDKIVKDFQMLCTVEG